MARRSLGADKKRALAGDHSIWFLDESGATLTPLVGKTRAPKGQTPALRHNFGHWDKVNLMSVVSHNGNLHFQLKLGEPFCNRDVVKFLNHHLRNAKDKLVVFIDGSGLHKGEDSYVFLAEREDRIRVVPSPPTGSSTTQTRARGET